MADLPSESDVSGPPSSEGALTPAPPELGVQVPKKHAQHLFSIRVDHAVRCDHPLVLISQPTRSGGTLLSQLFDGHTQLHAHPFELEIGYPRKSAWPELDLSDPPETWFEHLNEAHTSRLFLDGYRKDSRVQGVSDERTYPFMFVPSLQRELFLRQTEAHPKIESLRDVLDCYWTSYFNAWLDNHNLYDPDKRWVVGFRSGLGKPSNMKAFFGVYPDGRLVSAVRDPKAVLASKLKMDPDFAPRFDEHLDAFARATESRVESKQRWGDRIFLLTYEHLVADTEDVMRPMAEWLGLDYEPILSAPTFNRMPIKGNSSYKVENAGVFSASLESWRKVLSDEQAALVDEKMGDGYRELVRLAYEQPYGPDEPQIPAARAALSTALD